jgi:hypothetical protein
MNDENNMSPQNLNSPYNISGKFIKPSNYYADLARITDKVVDESNVFLKNEMKGFLEFVNKHEIETPRSANEYIVEYLTIGIYYNIYINNAIKSNTTLVYTLNKLYKLRKQSTLLKPYIDRVRGVLLPRIVFTHIKYPKYNFSEKEFEKLIKWLDATGDFSEEVSRLNNWCTYFKSLPAETVKEILSKSVSYAGYVTGEAGQFLGTYTK